MKKPHEPFDYPIDPLKYLVAGLDEAGRGPLVGEVVAACVVLDHSRPIKGLNDSKKLSEKRRNELYDQIVKNARAYGIAGIGPDIIDRINILNASFLAMTNAYLKMALQCNLLLIDGNRKIPDMPVAQQPVVRGDSQVPEIMAASILAKVTRDRQMIELDRRYPQYGFASHKGYPTELHLQRLAEFGVLPCYRKTYRPVQKILARGR